MTPELWAVLTAICWGVGSFFEKKGVHDGNLAPVMGTAVRTVTSLLILAAASWPFWGQLRTAGTVNILKVAIGGGVLAGAAGLLCFYKGFATGELSRVMAIAFSLTPVIGAALGIAFLGEGHGATKLVGIALAVAGTVLVKLG